MNRRDFVRTTAGLFLLATPASLLALAHAEASASAEADVANALAASDQAHGCQSLDRGEYANIIRGVNPTRAPGILSHSVGCKSPHKHVLFLENRYLENPSLIESEGTITQADGRKAKAFTTSPAYDMSFLVGITVGAHQHSVELTQTDIEMILSHPEGITKIAMQPRFIFGGTEPGHVFQLRRS